MRTVEALAAGHGAANGTRLMPWLERRLSGCGATRPMVAEKREAMGIPWMTIAELGISQLD